MLQTMDILGRLKFMGDGEGYDNSTASSWEIGDGDNGDRILIKKEPSTILNKKEVVSVDLTSLPMNVLLQRKFDLLRKKMDSGLSNDEQAMLTRVENTLIEVGVPLDNSNTVGGGYSEKQALRHALGDYNVVDNNDKDIYVDCINDLIDNIKEFSIGCELYESIDVIIRKIDKSLSITESIENKKIKETLVKAVEELFKAADAYNRVLNRVLNDISNCI